MKSKTPQQLTIETIASNNDHSSITTPNFKQEGWTISALIDELTFQLCTASIYEVHSETGYIKIDYKYIDYGRRLLFFTNLVQDPASIIFEISLQDLKPILVNELYQLEKETRNRVITDAVSQLYESISYDYFHKNAIRGKIRWRLTK